MSLSAEYHLLDALRNLDFFSVPGLGSFTREIIPAVISGNVLKAPKEVPVFSASIYPDGIDKFKEYLKSPHQPATTFPDAAEEIGRQIHEVLEAKGKFHLKNMGVLERNTEGISAQWKDDIHLRIFSNLHGFKDITLPNLVKDNHNKRPQASITPEPQTKIVPVSDAKHPVPVTPNPQPVPEQKVPDSPVVQSLKKTSKIPPAPQAQAEKTRVKTQRKPINKRKTVMLILLMLLLLGIPTLYLWIPADWFTPKEIVIAPPVYKPAPITIPEPIPEPVIIPGGYYLIVTSSINAQEIENNAEKWRKKGFDVRIIPTDESSDYNRLSIFHSTDRKEVVNKMIELKEDTYSWILQQ